mgnify:CR=1 FL=1
MYSSIANTTFSYLLTLDEIRRSLPEERMSSWVKITTITMVSKVLESIDIKTFRTRLEKLGSIKMRMKGTTFSGFEWKMKPTTFYNQVTLGYVDDYSAKSVKVFPNGSIQVAGCNDLFDCKRIITQLCALIKMVMQLEDDIGTDSFRVVMINTNFSLNHHINLYATAEAFGKNPNFKVSFDPDRYSAVKIKFKPASDMKEVTTSIFSTGKVIVTGAETLKEIAFSYNIINRFINANEHVYVQAANEDNSFDVFSGYNIETMVKSIKAKGFKPWTYTIVNQKINF